MTSIGMDVGTTSVKAVKLSGDGEVVGKAERTYPFETPRPGWTEQDPASWWAAAEGALDELGTDGIAGIGLSGQMHGLVPLDGAGEVIRPAILWNDQRTAAECDEIENALGLERLIELTGNRALTGFTAPKLLWVRNNERDNYDRIAHVLLPKDYVRYRLTGELAGDVSDCSGTLLFDVGARTWSEEVLAKLDLDPEWMPKVQESPEVSGTTEGGVAVAAGAGDQAAAAIGVGIVEPGVLSVAMGTSGVVLAALPTYETDDEARLHVFCHAVPASWHAMGVTLSAAGSLRWLRDTVAADEDFEVLLRRAEKWEPTTEGLTFLPYLAGERTPHADPDARASFTGLSLRHDTGALVRAVLEGVAYALRDSLELLRDLGVDARVGRVSGGGTRSRLWLEIVASVLGIPLEVPAAEEGSAFGAALLGGVASGNFADVTDATGRCVSVRETVDPRGEWSAAYDDGYARFRALYPAIRGVE